jgi:hypothetical protein
MLSYMRVEDCITASIWRWSLPTRIADRTTQIQSLCVAWFSGVCPRMKSLQ